MESPPAKRQRRLTVPSTDESDSEGNGVQTKQAPRTRSAAKKTTSKANLDVNPKLTSSKSSKPKPNAKSNGPLLRKTSTNSSKGSTPASSPEKKRGKNTIDTDGAKSKSLHSFFNTVTEEQRWKRTDTVDTPPPAGEIDDEIEDDSLDEALLLEIPDPPQDHKTVLDRRKVNGINPLKGDGSPSVGTNPQAIGTNPRSNPKPNPTQKFVKPSLPKHKSLDGAVYSKPWTDEFGPINLSELAVHKKKVMDVQNWLGEVFAGREHRSLLVIKGPAGSGKTATLALLSASMGFEVKEWRNPDGLAPSDDGSSSKADQFDEFLNRRGRFSSLDLSGSPTSISEQPSSDDDEKPRITIVEEFPNSFTQSSSSSQSFRSSILKYLATNTRSPTALFSKTKGKIRSNPPLVFIISETLLTSSFASSDSFTAYRLLGPDISNHSGVCTIEFNAIAPTYIAKALDLVLKKEARKSGRRRIPGPAVIKSLSESGDLRSAISSLEFMCLRGDGEGEWGGRVAAKTKTNGLTLTNMEKESLEMVRQREATLGIFHAVGKVVYNKRELPKVPLHHPPDHLEAARRPKAPEVEVESLIDETGTDTQTFIAALHENFVLSCDNTSFTEHFEVCIDALSDSDLLNLSSFRGLRSSAAGIGTGRATYQGTNLESLRQDETSFQVAVRGLLFALPYPVKRGYGAVPGGGINGKPVGKLDHIKMFYPASSRIWKHTEETEGILTNWINKNMLAETDDMTATPKKSSDVESWKNRNSHTSPSKYDDEGSNTVIMRTSRSEILLERLPYMNQISRQRPLPADLDKLTKFHGVDSPSVDVEEDEKDDQTTGGPPDTPSRRRAGKWMAAVTKESGIAIPVEHDVEKLVLSDDDIEDD